MDDDVKARKSEQSASGLPIRSSGRHAQPSKRLLDSDFAYESVKRGRKSNADSSGLLESESLSQSVTTFGDYTPSTKAKKPRARDSAHEFTGEFDALASAPSLQSAFSTLDAQSGDFFSQTAASSRFEQSSASSFEPSASGRTSAPKIKMRFGKKPASSAASNPFTGPLPPQSDSLSFGFGSERSNAARYGMSFEPFDLPGLSGRGPLLHDDADALLDSSPFASKGSFGVPNLSFGADYKLDATPFGDGTPFGANHGDADTARSHGRSRRQEAARPPDPAAARSSSATGFDFVAPPSGLKISLFGRRANTNTNTATGLSASGSTPSLATNESETERSSKKRHSRDAPAETTVTPKLEPDAPRPAIDYTLDYDAARLNDDDELDDDEDLDFDGIGLERLPIRESAPRGGARKKTGRKGGKWKKRRKRTEPAGEMEASFDDNKHADPDFIYSARANAALGVMGMHAHASSRQPLIKAGGYNVEADWRCAICDRFAAEIVGRKNQVAVPDRYRLIYYGVPTCKGCQVFFRKMIMEMKLKGQLYGTIPCPNASACTLLAGVGFCVACRFNRCVNSFPPPDALKPQRTPEGEIAKTVLEKPLLDKVNRESDADLPPYLRMRPRVSFGSSSTLHRAGRHKAMRRTPVRIGTQVKLDMPAASFSFLPSLADGTADRPSDTRSTDSPAASQPAAPVKNVDAAPKQKTERDLHFYKELSAMYQLLNGLRDGHADAYEYDSDSHSDSNEFDEPDDLLKKLVGAAPPPPGPEEQKTLAGDAITAALARDDVLEMIAGRLGAENDAKRAAAAAYVDFDSNDSRQRRRADANRNESHAPDVLGELLGLPKPACTNRSISRASALGAAREPPGRFYSDLQLTQHRFARRTAQLLASRRAIRCAIATSNKNQRSRSANAIRTPPNSTVTRKSTRANPPSDDELAERMCNPNANDVSESVRRMQRAIENRIGVSHDAAVAEMRRVARRCRTCAACVAPDCGRCRACLDKAKFGGRNVLRQACCNRVCVNAQLAKGVEAATFRAKELRRQRVLAANLDAEKERDAKLACELKSQESDTDNNTSNASASAPAQASTKQRVQLDTNGHEHAGIFQIAVDWCESQRLFVSNRLDELDNVDEWDTGVALVVHKDNLPPMSSNLCLLCGATCRQPLVCVGCCEPFDWFCIPESERPHEATEISNWCCRRCRVCNVCSKPNYLRTCATCRNHFHPHCVAKHYPHRLGEDGCWLCAQCAVCAGCDRHAADDPDAWSEQFDFCKSCHALMQRGNYCPICRKTYRDDDYSAKMVQCSKCRKWIHASCQQMTDEQYEMFAQLPEEQAPYKCDPCTVDELRASRAITHSKAVGESELRAELTTNREWPRIIDEHMYEGFQAVVEEITADDGARKSGTDAVRSRYDDDDEADDWLSSRNAPEDDDGNLDDFGHSTHGSKARKESKNKKKKSSRRYADEEFNDLDRDDIFEDDADAFDDDDDDDEYSPRKRSDAASSHRSSRKGGKHRRGAEKKHSHRHHHRSRYSDSGSATDDDQYEFGKRRPVGVSGSYRAPPTQRSSTSGHNKQSLASAAFRNPVSFNPMASGAPEDDLGLYDLGLSAESLNNAVSFAGGSLAQFDGTSESDLIELLSRPRVRFCVNLMLQVDGAGDDEEEHEGATYGNSMNINNFLSMFDFMVAPSATGSSAQHAGSGSADTDPDAPHDAVTESHFLPSNSQFLPAVSNADYLPGSSAASPYSPSYLASTQAAQAQAAARRNRKSLELLTEGATGSASFDFELDPPVAPPVRAPGPATFATSDWHSPAELARQQQQQIARTLTGQPIRGRTAFTQAVSTTPTDTLKKTNTFKPSDALKPGSAKSAAANASGVVDEEAYFGSKPRDFFQVREKIERREYRTVAEFCDDLIRIVQRRLLISRDSTPDVQSHTLWVKVTFTKAMRRAFAWFNVEDRPAWTASRFPVDLIPHATIPPNQDHSYARYRDAHEAPTTRSNRERRAAQQTAAQCQPDARTMAIINTARLEGEARLVRLEEEEQRLANRLDESEAAAESGPKAEQALGLGPTDSKNAPDASVPTVTGVKTDSEVGQTVPGDVCKQQDEQPATLDWCTALANHSAHFYVPPDADCAARDNRMCVLCHAHGDQPPRAGDRLLHCGAGVWVHANCALWSSRCVETPAGDGSVLRNVEDCIIEGIGALCDACSQPGATVRCARAMCAHAFHFPCATRREGCRFRSDWRMLCDLHAQTASDRAELNSLHDHSLNRTSTSIYLTSEHQFAVSRVVRLPTSSRRFAAVVDFVRSVWPRYCGAAATADEQCVPGGTTMPACDARVLVGGLAVTSLGRLVRASHRADYLRPLGFSSTRLFWSAQRASRLVRYANRIVPASAERVALLQDLAAYESGLASASAAAASESIAADAALKTEPIDPGIVAPRPRRDALVPDKPDNHLELCDLCTLGSCVSMATVLTSQTLAFVGAPHSFGAARNSIGSARQTPNTPGSASFRSSLTNKVAPAANSPRFATPGSAALRRVAVPAQAHTLQSSLAQPPPPAASALQPKVLPKMPAGAIMPRSVTPVGNRMVTPLMSNAVRAVATSAPPSSTLANTPSTVRIVQLQKQQQPAVTLRIQQPQAATTAAAGATATATAVPIAIRPKPLISVVVPRAAGSNSATSLAQPRVTQPLVGRVQPPVRTPGLTLAPGQTFVRHLGIRAPLASSAPIGLQPAKPRPVAAVAVAANLDTVIEQKSVEPVLSDTDFLDLLVNDQVTAGHADTAAADESQAEIVATSLANIIVETLPLDAPSSSQSHETAERNNVAHHASAHQAVDGDDERVSCSSCSRVFDSQAAFQQHVLVCAASVFGDDGASAMDVDAQLGSAGDCVSQLDGATDMEVGEDHQSNANAAATSANEKTPASQASLELDADRVELLYEVVADDGYRVLARDPFTAWHTVLRRVNERREQAALRPLGFHSVNGATLFGLANRRVIQLVEQLTHRHSAYPARYYTRGAYDSDSGDEQEAAEHEEHASSHSPASSRTMAVRDAHTARRRDSLMFLRNAQRSEAHLALPTQIVRTGDVELGGLGSSGVSSALLKFRTWSTRELHSRLTVLRSPIHGRGLFAARIFADGESICELRGELVRTIVADKRAREYERRGVVAFYFRVDRDTVLDATQRGSLARFVNHSCSPNCSIKVVTFESRKRLVLVATRKIAKNEELSCDYRNVEYRPPTERTRSVPCTCGSKKCTKFLALAVGSGN